MRTPKAFAGTWRILETELWEPDVLDEFVPAHMTFDPTGGGVFEFSCVHGEMDCAFDGNRVEFSWTGNDEMDPASGRGRAEITKQGRLKGRIYFHQGDDSWFVAHREGGPASKKRSQTKRSPSH